MIKAREVNLKSQTFQDNKSATPVRQYLNVLIKRYFKEKGFKEWDMNEKFYDPSKMNQIPEFFLEVYTGFKTSCEVYQNYTPKILIDFASKIVRSDNALYYINNAQSTNQAREMILGRSVIASYGNFRMWRIHDIDFTINPTQTFDDGHGKKISFADYFRNKYNVVIKDLRQPLLKSVDPRTHNVSYLVPELVQITGLDNDMKENSSLMTEVAKCTCLGPNQRMQKIKSLSVPLADFLSKDYGITMDQQASVNGFVLNVPKLTLGNGSFIPDKGNYQLRVPVFKPANFDKWLFVYCEACQQDAEVFLETLGECSSAYAIKVEKPLKCAVKDKSPEALKETIRARVTPDIQIVVCMYPTGAKKSWYKALKDVCFKEKGVPSQAIVSDSLKKNSMSVCSKILLQMNAKIGSELWITGKPQGLPERTMIIGAHVYHARIGQDKKSCIGFCASLNLQFSKFYSKVAFQNRKGQNIMNSIGKLVKEAVLRYFAYNGKKLLPECIIFFRDGVTKKQLQTVLRYETKAILEQFKTIDPKYNFKFAEVVVTKRIDDRLFSTESTETGLKTDGRNDGDVFNPPAGTVVADSVVSNNFDFLLVSQNVTQGTCIPTHYNVIYDTTGLPQDVFWQLSYFQCYNYLNWNGGVRVPAPLQYAHKLAYLVGRTMQGEPDKKLDETLYFL